METKEKLVSQLSKVYITCHLIAAVLGGLSAILASKLGDRELILETLIITLSFVAVSMITDVRVLNFSTLATTFGVASSNTTVIYKPFLQAITEKDILSGKEVEKNSILLVEYDRKNKKAPCAVGGTLYIVCNVLSTYINLVLFVLTIILIYRVLS